MARKLKTALANYQLQNKLAEKQERKAQHSAKLKIDQKAARAARRNASSPSKPAWLPFSIDLEDFSDESVLLIGEGDFSFALSLVEKFPNLPVIATSLDTREEVEMKYDRGEETLEKLEVLEVPLLHGIDCTKLSLHIQKSHILQGTIGMAVFMFPHIGNSMANQDRNIRQHQILLKKFFEECAKAKIAKVLITLFDGEPYESWQPKQLARSQGYSLERSGKFPWESFEHYSHQLTSKGSSHTSKKQYLRQARMFLWTMGSSKPEKAVNANKSKGKSQNSKADADDSEED